MHFQPVHFSEDSASAIECAAALTQAALTGQLVAEARANPSLAQMNIARIINWAIESIKGPTVWGESSNESETVLNLLQVLEVPVPAAGPLSAALLQLLINQLLKVLQDLVTDATSVE